MDNSDNSNDLLTYADEDLSNCNIIKKDLWKVLIVDDEEDVHILTKLVLRDYSFEGRKLQFISAYSAEEANKTIEENPDTALLLLDVVMEEYDSGLKVVRHIRDVLDNRFVRIILRTGQPGRAPEQEIVSRYDINDYKTKTELTSQKLFTAVTSSLRAFRDIQTIEMNRRGLLKIIDSSENLFELQSLEKLAAGILTQLISILRLEDTSLYLRTSGFAAAKEDDNYYIVAATGQFEDKIGKPVNESVPKSILQLINKAGFEKKSIFDDDQYIGYFKTKNNSENLIYLKGCHTLTENDKHLISVYANNVAVAFDNIQLNQNSLKTKEDLIFTLGEVMETHSKETTNHVKRVAEISRFLLNKKGTNSEEASILYHASPMHDVGKAGIPDIILKKPGRLTNEEFQVIKTHTVIGHDILKRSPAPIMQTAAKIALEHHEKWDGTGYPAGLKGQEIHPFSRITCLADVFDSMSHKRVYRDKIEQSKVLEFLKKEKGKHFDPELVDLLLNNIDELNGILEKYKDGIKEDGR